MATIMIRAASPNDRERIESLLLASGLPLDGVADHFSSFFVVEDRGRILGVAGVEFYGEHALLRSVAVASETKGTGVGTLLTRHAIDEVRARGARALYLLTTTAEKFFPRFGFEPITRDDVPEALRASREFQGACPLSATAMRRVV